MWKTHRRYKRMWMRESTRFLSLSHSLSLTQSMRYAYSTCSLRGLYQFATKFATKFVCNFQVESLS